MYIYEYTVFQCRARTAGQGAGGIKDRLARAKKGGQIAMAEMMGLMIGSALSDESMKELEDNMRKKGLA